MRTLFFKLTILSFLLISFAACRSELELKNQYTVLSTNIDPDAPKGLGIFSAFIYYKSNNAPLQEGLIEIVGKKNILAKKINPSDDGRVSQPLPSGKYQIIIKQNGREIFKSKKIKIYEQAKTELLIYLEDD